jgi:gluconolactonase
LPFDGVYLLKGGKLHLLDKTFPLPNGLELVPGEKYLQLNDTRKETIMRFEVQPDDAISKAHVFAGMTSDQTPGHPDGMKVDLMGTVHMKV